MIVIDASLVGRLYDMDDAVHVVGHDDPFVQRHIAIAAPDT